MVQRRKELSDSNNSILPQGSPLPCKPAIRTLVARTREVMSRAVKQRFPIGKQKKAEVGC
ncbi:hypothetical protein B0H12DRAFT_1142928 [Mycena haematopus]|nr:hypothetical protein B0H12DRAFT_1142928 [Mycena haematopus]